MTSVPAKFGVEHLAQAAVLASKEHPRMRRSGLLLLLHWPTRTHHGACRNAAEHSAALAAVRREREKVDR